MKLLGTCESESELLEGVYLGEYIGGYYILKEDMRSLDYGLQVLKA